MGFLVGILSGSLCALLALGVQPQSSSTTQVQQAAPAQAAPPTALQRLDQDLLRHDRPGESIMSEKKGTLGWLLIDWGGWRKTLADNGLEVELLYVTDGSWAIAGGADPDGTALRSLLDVGFDYDPAPALGWTGGLFHADVQWITGVDGSTRFGVLQAVSNIDADRRLQVARFWYEQVFESSQTRLRVGKMDANSLFASINNGSYFLNASMGYSPTILGLPTYPNPAYGAAVAQSLGGGFKLSAGIFDGSGYAGVQTGLRGPSSLWEAPQDAFAISELDYSWESSLPGFVGLGVWGLDGEIARFDGSFQDSTGGVYAVFNQRLWNAEDDPEQKLGTFLQLGLADKAVSPFVGHLGTGVVMTEPFSSLQSDFIGLGMTCAKLSDDPGAGFSEANETVFEFFLGFEALPWLRVKPDLQYVVNPGGDAGVDDAWIATLRVTMGL